MNRALIFFLLLFANAADAQRSDDIDRAMAKLSAPQLTVAVGSKSCDMDEDEARRVALEQIAKNGLQLAESSPSNTTYLKIGLQCFPYKGNGGLDAIFYAAEIALSEEVVTLPDLMASKSPKHKGGPELTVAKIWSDSLYGSAAFVSRSSELDDTIKALVDSFTARIKQAKAAH